MKMSPLLFLGMTLISSIVCARSVRDLPDDEKVIVDGRLDLSGKDLTSLDGLNEIAGLTNLEKLYLSDNQLSSLPEGVFAGLKNLKVLYLPGNQLSTLPEGVFAGLTNLQSLFLNDNRLSTLPGGVFAGLTNLRVLGLSYNQLSSLPEGVAGLTNLERLGLRNNQLRSLSEGVFTGLTHLARLDLTHNQLSSQQVAAVRRQFQGRPIFSYELDTEYQEAPPITLEPNITPEEWEQLSQEQKEEVCGICLLNLSQEDAYKTACPPQGHIFHADCLSRWLDKSRTTGCPVCRRDVFAGEGQQRMPGEPFACNNSSKKKNIHLAKRTKKKKHNKIAKCRRNKKVKTAIA